jgi:hypothetical protein
MLDRRLAAHHRLNDFEDYISGDKNWSLIKLHGSVNWVYELPEEIDPYPPPQELRIRDQDLRCHSPGAPLSEIRGNRGGRDRYPALAMPEGAEDRLVLPSRHQWWIKQRLEAAPNLDLLVIGYSGLDIEVLNLIKSTETSVRLMTIVNQSLEAAITVRDRFSDAGISPVWTHTAKGDFAEWADLAGLDRLVSEFGGRYSDVY